LRTFKYDLNLVLGTDLKQQADLVPILQDNAAALVEAMRTAPRLVPGVTAGEMLQRHEALLAEMWRLRRDTL
jgi:hypothetical protein